MWLFRSSGRQAVARAEEVRRWCIDALQPPDGSFVMVRQVECSEPDCPPIETVIALLTESQPPRQWKLPVSLDVLTREQVLEALAADGFWKPSEWSCPD
jgi:hypothetical protein